MDSAAFTLFGRARYAVLEALCLLKRDQSLGLRETARRAGISPTAAQYELRLLGDVELVVEQRAGRQVAYRLNERHANAKDVKRLILALSEHRMIEVKDDEHWARKRVQQRVAYASDDLALKSPFLADPAFVRACQPLFDKAGDE